MIDMPITARHCLVWAGFFGVLDCTALQMLLVVVNLVTLR